MNRNTPRRRRNQSPSNGACIEYILYCRKSSKEDTGKQILSLDRQESWAKRTGGANSHLIKMVLKEEQSARTPYRRPVFNDLVTRIKQGDAQGIYVWKLDRLARNPEEAGIILGMLSRGDIQHIITSQREYYPEDNAIISYVDFGLADQYSRDLSVNVHDGLHNRARNGYYPAYAPIGYLNTKNNEKGTNKILVDPDRFAKLKEAFQLFLTGDYSVPKIKHIAETQWLLTARGGKKRPERPLTRSAWYRIFSNTFYSGHFEYPKGSGNWCVGNHKPMITLEEFERIQVLLGRKGKPRGIKRNHPYLGLFKCGSCPAMVTAEAKVKRQKNGNVHFYTYYHCTKRVQRNCPERSIEINDLERQVLDKLSTVTISDDFKDFAIRCLETENVEDERKNQSMRENKIVALNKIDQQLHNLNVKFTSVENIGGEIFSDTEYLSLKRELKNSRLKIETALQRSDGELIQYANEQTKNEFILAHNVRARFLTGDNEARQNIVSRIGSNRTLKDRNVAITLRKPLKSIAENRDIVENEISKVRTSKKLDNTTDITDLVTACRLMRRLVDEVRTYFIMNYDAD